MKLKKNIWVLCLIAFLTSSFSGCFYYKSHTRHVIDEEKKILDTAQSMCDHGEYKNARDLLSLYILSHPMGKYKETVQYLLALSFFEQGLYEKAEYEFEMFLRNYKSSRRVSEIKEKLRICREPFKRIPDSKIALKPYLEDRKITFEEPLKSSKKNELRCAQILVLNAANFDEVRAEIEKMKKNNVDTIILRVFQNRGDRFYPFIKPRYQTGVYFDTTEAPVVYDILKPIIDICRENGMKIFAWMTTRYCDWFSEEHFEYMEKEFDLETKKIISSKGLNIFHPVVIDYLTKLYMDLALNDIDGILFQDDLVLRHTQGFNEFGMIEFEDLYGIKLNPKKMFQDTYSKGDGKTYVEEYAYPFDIWAKFKNQKILELADRIMRVVHAVNSDVKFALNLYYETVSDPPNALRWLSQDIEAAKNYNFDYYSMMSYHDQIAKELSLSRNDAIYFIGKLASRLASILEDPSMALLKIQIIDWDSGKFLSAWEIDDAFEALLQTKGISLAFVPYRGDVALDVIKKNFEK